MNRMLLRKHGQGEIKAEADYGMKVGESNWPEKASNEMESTGSVTCGMYM